MWLNAHYNYILHLSTEVTIGFTEDGYGERETQPFYRNAAVIRDINIANPVTVQVRSLTYTQFTGAGMPLPNIPSIPVEASGKAYVL